MSLNTAVLLAPFPVFEGIVCGSPVVIAKVTLGECVLNIYYTFSQTFILLMT